ncbi:MAG: MNIO family bufferin maturase [Endozoicomonas sp.]|uniref:MNIO family bufferin maturase n=1 Tax=Endozoicomonas sp. TaxID=1892382 RepID=UPI003D9B7FD5
MSQLPDQRPISAGIGLREVHFNQVLEHKPHAPWLEAMTDNFLFPTHERESLLAIREHYPMTLHGVGMSLGSSDPLNREYLSWVKQLRDDLEPAWLSDHLCWTSIAGTYLHELMPLPYTEEAIGHIAERIMRVQDFLGEQILVENVSSYIRFNHSQFSEAEFFAAVLEKADCYALLDVNNVYVNACNHDYDPLKFLATIPSERVKEIHLGGHTATDQGFLLDTHGSAIAEPVWALYEQCLQLTGEIPTLIEWDTDIPAWQTLDQQAKKAAALMIDSGKAS